MPFFPLVVTLVGATLDVGVSAPAVYVTPATKPETWTALIDTGATISVISPAVSATISVISPAVKMALDPPHLGIAPVQRAGGVRSFERTYEIRIRLGGHRVVSSRWFPLEAVELQPATPNVDVILGSDLLIHLELLWRGPAGFGVLSY